MFDITSSKLLLLGIVALLVIGPKDFPVLLRTIGKYVGIIRGHAREFRAQFDEAMRESELDQLKKEVEKIATETEASVSSAGQSVERSLDEARRTLDAPAEGTPAPAASLPDPMAHDANGLPVASPQASPAIPAPNGAHEEAARREPAPDTDAPSPAPEAGRPAERSGA